jgi:hypothetical protein
MGIDVTAAWRGMTNEERQAQGVWSDPYQGHVGYLREAYVGELYATHLLAPEAFEKGEAPIAAALLRERLPAVLAMVEGRERELYGSDTAQIKRALDSFRDFVALCEAKERETGEPCLIRAIF